MIHASVLSVSAGFALMAEMIIRTGELRPQDPVDPERLLFLDRPIALAEEREVSGHILSDTTLALTVGYAIFDTVRAGLRGSGDGWSTYLVLYAESAAINWALATLAKIAFRRPRPAAYFELRETGMVSDDTNSALSFYSGHTAITSGLVATATYLAFTRGAPAWERWLTLGAGTVLTTYVAVQRVRARAHFPTDVIAGGLVGAGVGILVPHLNRGDGRRPVGIPVGPSGSTGFTLTGRF